MSNEDIESLEIIGFWMEISKSLISTRADFIGDCAEKFSEFAGFLIWHHDVVDVLKFKQSNEVILFYSTEQCGIGISYKSNWT